MLENVCSIAKLAIIYNQLDVFKKALLLCSFATKDDLLEVCYYVFERCNLQGLLLDQELQELTKNTSLTDASQFVCLYQLLREHKNSGDHIKKAMTKIPDVHRFINILFDTSENEYVMCTGLSPLQSYVFGNMAVDLSVVRTLIDLGADIDVLFPPALKAYKRTHILNLFNKDVNKDPQGQTLLMYIVNNEGAFEMGFRELLELLLYENVSLAMNNSIIASGLNRYVFRILHSAVSHDVNLIRLDKSTYFDLLVEAGVYTIDATFHEAALDYTVPLLIEAGFKYDLSDIDKALKLLDESSEKGGKSPNQCVDETRTSHHFEKTIPSESVKAYLQRCLSEPRSLKLRCRDVLRNHFRQTSDT